ncbi:anti-sigma-K factor RskA [Palleronia aestuarii]|uniref:Regulator of SigK n=1 Tax=Palleronia aestuarii TaxID=568105 RepID=A0A2W7N9B6_9RHOB|nr:anti-sigma factor [Palleronia aestuarii]PZX16243.1 anti-sigma-K factor RskA [Palleronia aestuarii]
MTDTSFPHGGPDRSDSVRAAEYVLNLLDAGERSDFEGQLATDGGLRARVAEWTETFIALAQDVAEERPPARCRDRLERTLFAAPTETAGRARRGGLARGLLAGAALALAATVALFAILPGAPTMPGDGAYRAQIAAEDGSFSVRAAYDPARRVLVLMREAGTTPPGRVQQLWLLPEGATAPLSVAILPEEEVVTLEVAGAIADGIPGGLLEISEEPPGGSPEAGPTGNVLGLGTVGDTPT